MNSLPLPERAYTCLPPWPQAKAYADKRLENRGYGVARQIGEWRGLVAVSQSKIWDPKETREALGFLKSVHLLNDRLALLGRDEVQDWAGKLVLVAELVDVLPPERCAGAAWHVPGQWGLILGRVWLVEPVPVSGGQGLWTPMWCARAHCRHIQADSQGQRCKACGEPSQRWSGTRPELRVVRECMV